MSGRQHRRWGIAVNGQELATQLVEKRQSVPATMSELMLVWACTKDSRQDLSVLEIAEFLLIHEALEQNQWNQKHAAELLRLSPRVMNYKVGKYGITHRSWYRNKE